MTTREPARLNAGDAALIAARDAAPIAALDAARIATGGGDRPVVAR